MRKDLWENLKNTLIQIHMKINGQKAEKWQNNGRAFVFICVKLTLSRINYDGL